MSEDSDHMLLDFLSSKYRHLIDEGWGAFEVGNLKRAEEHFRAVLAHDDDPHVTVFDLAEAQNGVGAVHFEHKDFFEALRWYKEALHTMERHYPNGWPRYLHWYSLHDRPAMRALFGLGTLSYARGNLKKAQEYYEHLLALDKEDELGAKCYLSGIIAGKTFEQVNAG